MHFLIFMVGEIPGIILISILHKIFFPYGYENYNKCGRGHLQ